MEAGLEKSKSARIAVMGAGLIGVRHVEQVKREARLASIVDPWEGAEAIAVDNGVPYFNSLADMLAQDRPDGVIIATPNQVHVENGLECIDAGIAALVEKPIADDVAGAEKLVARAEAAGVPLLVGHHRRHNPLIQKAKKLIEEGAIGNVHAVQGTCWFFKPDDYFDVAWRREKGAGPILVNLIHDIDLLRYLCGDVTSVSAHESNAYRGNAVEETAGILLFFENGAIGTVSVSDAIAAPWSWEMTAGENPAYPPTRESCYVLGGSKGSLSIPDLSLWQYKDKASWWEPISRTSLPVRADDPLALQIQHFSDVCLGRAEPIVSGREGLETLRVITAVKTAAETGQTVKLR
ncbi:MAG: Gfo/Idh/MocA family oxidoreductase [Rhodospirillales bacterium]|nr:Gfo/Idh/MocA family oxidoreductase [Rhodospirillales bacterium]